MCEKKSVEAAEVHSWISTDDLGPNGSNFPMDKIGLEIIQRWYYTGHDTYSEAEAEQQLSSLIDIQLFESEWRLALFPSTIAHFNLT